MRRAPLVPVLAWSAWVLVVVAGRLDPGHDMMGDYLSWLVHGPFGAVVAVALVLFAAAAALGARHLHRLLDPGRVREAVVALVASAAVLVLATLALPSRGHDEPLWRTAVHVGLAVGAYAGFAGAALWVGWASRLAGPGMRAWAWTVVVAHAWMLVAATLSRFVPAIELRGLAQIMLMGTAALWLTAVGLQWAQDAAPACRLRED